MAYVTGGIIEATDYNSFVQQINSVYSDLYPGATTVPYADYGYGASANLPLVAAGDIVTAAQWTALLNRVGLCGTHQGTSIGVLPSLVNVGDPVVALSTLSGVMNSIVANRLTIAAGQSSVILGTSAASSSAWLSTRSWTWQVNFSTWDNARYFFNQGGSLTIAGSYTGGSSPSIDAFWTTMLSNMGTVSMRAIDSNPAYNNKGFYDLTTAYQEFYRKAPSGGGYYTNSYISVEAKLAAAAGTNGIVDFRIRLADGDPTPDSKTGLLSFTPGQIKSAGVIPYTGPLTITNGTFGS